jgi:hypothetical protein
MSIAEVADSGPVDLALRPVLKLAQLRRRIATALPGVREDRLGDVLLVGNELVRNAYQHGAGPRPVRLRRLPDRVRVEVDDASPYRLPVLRPPGADAPRLGLLVVTRLSVDWGVDQHGDHKTVWAEVDLGEPARAR